MRKDIQKIIEVPQGVSVSTSDNFVFVSKGNKILKRKIDLGKAKMEISNGKIRLFAEKGTKKEARSIGTFYSHLKNMIKGVQEDFVYKLEICNVHFPMNVKVEQDKLVIKSFLGEKYPRYAKILPNVKVEVKGNEVIVSSYDLEAAGQTAANIEKATRVKNRDLRVFQDGIFIVSKPKGKL